MICLLQLGQNVENSEQHAKYLCETKTVVVDSLQTPHYSAFIDLIAIRFINDPRNCEMPHDPLHLLFISSAVVF